MGKEQLLIVAKYRTPPPCGFHTPQPQDRQPAWLRLRIPSAHWEQSAQSSPTACSHTFQDGRPPACSTSAV